MYQQPQGPGGLPPGFASPSLPPWVAEKAKKKRRVVLVLVIVAVLALLVGGGVTGGVFASQYYKSTGASPTSTPAPPECESLRPAMERMGAPNLVEVKSDPPSAAATSSKLTACTWRPSLDEHVRHRSVHVSINAFTGPEAELKASDYNPPSKGEVVPQPDVSGRAWSRVERTSGAYSMAELWAQRGPVQVWVMYSAMDKGFFTDERLPGDLLVDEAKAAAMAAFESAR
ncbi:hypothetical protein ABT256_37150 [Amycolatopsis japonica]|uniref:hypothetical protein n=1 Tax=Amycolatopsis japonica TaxID=208439 RepID=UPI00332427A6